MHERANVPSTRTVTSIDTEQHFHERTPSAAAELLERDLPAELPRFAS